MNEVPSFRRLVYRHTAGPHAGLDQIVGFVDQKHFVYLLQREARPHKGPVPDKLSAIPMWPDGRMAKAMRLKTTDRYVMYQEVPCEP